MTQKLIIGIAPAVSVEIESDNVKDIIERASFWGCLPPQCPLCQAEVSFFYRTPQDNAYWGMQCNGEKTHQTNFGVFKDLTKGLYYKGDGSWHEWSGRGNAGDEDDAPSDAASEPRAEHERLDRLITDAWSAKRRPKSFADAVKERFNTTPEKLTISQKRDILAKLQE